MENNEKECCICSSNVSLLQVQEKWICENCLHIGNEQIVGPWKTSLEKLIHDYTDSCFRCVSSEDPEDVHHARVLGRKIRVVLEFLGLPKDHDLLLAVKQMHHRLNKVREADVLLGELKNQSEENQVYTEMIKLTSKKHEKLHSLLTEEIPAVINESFFNKAEVFTNNELVPYILRSAKEDTLVQYEEQFNELVDAYYQSVEENGKTAKDTIEALHSVRIISKSLRYLYNYVNETFGSDYLDKEKYYKELQNQFGHIIDIKDWLNEIKECQKRINAPKDEIREVKKQLKATLQNLVENVELQKVNSEEAV